MFGIYNYTSPYQQSWDRQMNIDETLKDRGEKYGTFKTQAQIAQSLKYVLRAQPGWENLTWDMKEAMDMTMHKYARALNGNPNLHDTWHDIVGYNKLVADNLTTEK